MATRMRREGMGGGRGYKEKWRRERRRGGGEVEESYIDMYNVKMDG